MAPNLVKFWRLPLMERKHSNHPKRQLRISTELELLRSHLVSWNQLMLANLTLLTSWSASTKPIKLLRSLMLVLRLSSKLLRTSPGKKPLVESLLVLLSFSKLSRPFQFARQLIQNQWTGLNSTKLLKSLNLQKTTWKSLERMFSSTTRRLLLTSKTLSRPSNPANMLNTERNSEISCMLPLNQKGLSSFIE